MGAFALYGLHIAQCCRVTAVAVAQSLQQLPVLGLGSLAFSPSARPLLAGLPLLLQLLLMAATVELVALTIPRRRTSHVPLRHCCCNRSLLQQLLALELDSLACFGRRASFSTPVATILLRKFFATVRGGVNTVGGQRCCSKRSFHYCLYRLGSGLVSAPSPFYDSEPVICCFSVSSS